MKLSNTILPEFDNEMAKTRTILERIPTDKFVWKPHEKSWTMGDLATHLANIPSWTLHTLNEDSLDMAPSASPPPRVSPADSPEDVLARFDKNVAEARTAIAGTSDEHFHKPWSLLSGGNTVFTLPRIAVLRSFVLNHNIHHRAQLGVYLRLNDVAVPAIYGPSADESGM
ncbi:MAG: DinB family protein [bacterium]